MPDEINKLVDEIDLVTWLEARVKVNMSKGDAPLTAWAKALDEKSTHFNAPTPPSLLKWQGDWFLRVENHLSYLHGKLRSYLIAVEYKQALQT